MLKVYTDGASRGNPGKGGWGVVGFLNHKVIFEIGGSSVLVTNNQMELLAMINGVSFVLKNCNSVLANSIKDIELLTDSQYVVKGMNEWRSGWVKNNWKNSQKKEVLNRNLWERLISVHDELRSKNINVIYKYVKGHAGDEGNERADKIATECADASSSHLVEWL